MKNRIPDLLRDIPVGPKAPLMVPRDFDRLYDLAYNMWWSWDPLAYELWARIEPRRWTYNRNPLSLLTMVERQTWEALAENASFLELYHEVTRRFDHYLAESDTWFSREIGELPGPIAYLCAEFGIHNKLPFYSGGLGVLAGDHVKAASDLGLPLVGVGLLYRRGYFRQAVDPDGNQQHTYLPLEIQRRALREVLDPHTGRPLRVPVEMPGRTIQVGAWRIDVGRVPVLLLDTDLPDNDPADRPITHILYVRGREMRFCQEMVLGIGGTRVLEALDLEPAVWHVNEGHSALSLLERISKELERGADLDIAMKRVRTKTLFTLHTPVPAGNEVFDLGVVRHYLNGSIEGLDEDLIANLAKAHDHDEGRFDMGALAIRLSAMTNGVSKRHGEVVSRDWGHLLDGEAPGITNGVHAQTWVGRNMGRLFRKHIGEDWSDRLDDAEAWQQIHEVPRQVVWDTHNTQKEIMLRHLRARLREQYARHGHSPEKLRWIDDQLPADRLTMVWARRFATYKRAGLIFSDPGRIRHLLTNPERPMQLIFAGKAHPADREGQGLIRWVVEMSRSHELEGHIFFIEDYDMSLAQTLVAGADVWLNTPRPPAEASGTSGMKAAMNGALNLSVLDGWWVEGYDGENGWGFSPESHSDAEDAGILYHLLESEVVPLFYDRDEEGVPTGWVDKMRHAIAGITPRFSTHRMIEDYTRMAYGPLGRS